jgi:hypothetical protein
MAINPIQLQKYLKGIKYPVAKGAIVETAKSNGAADDVISALEALADHKYDTPAAVNHGLKEANQT